MKVRFTTEEGKIVLVVVLWDGVTVTYPIPVVTARNLNAQLTALLKSVPK